MHTIKQAVEVTGLSEVYIRRAISRGDLKTRKELVPGTKNNYRNVIENLDEWRESTKAHSKRDDGRNKYALYATSEEIEKLEELMKSAGLELPFARANLKKEIAE